MQERVKAQILRLNREFYQKFSEPFSESRQRLQPGVLRALRSLSGEESILDIGCGNGLLARQLYQEDHPGTYTGLDSSPELLAIARRSNEHPHVRFIQADLAETTWTEGLAQTFDQIFAFAVLHHLPSTALRQRVLQQMRAMMAENALLRLSVWDFHSSARLRKRIVPWSQIGVADDEVEPGDYLVDWRRGGYGLRYVHLFEPRRLERLAQAAGFAVADQYRSDGEGGQLGLYQVWKPS